MKKEQFDIETFKEYTRKEKTCVDVCKRFNLSILDFWNIVGKLKKDGINVIVSGSGEDSTILNLDERNLNGDNIHTIDIGDENEFKALLISDTRLGSKYQQLSRLNNAYEEAFKNGYRNVIHLGDITEGLYALKNPYYQMLFSDTTDSQIKYVVDNYPYIEGVKTYFITGDQDTTHTSKNGIDIGRKISELRDDMIYLGNMRCLINVKKMKILAQHLKVGAFDRAKTISLKQQDAISAIRSEEKVDIILDGHTLIDQQITERDMEEISVSSLVSTTPRIRNSAIPHNVGYVLLTAYLTKDGRFKEKEVTYAPYYQTYKDDYSKVKVLKRGAKNNEI